MSLMTPFGTPATPDAGTPAPDPVPEPAGSSQRKLVLVGAVLAVLAAAAGAYLFLFSGSGEDDASLYALGPLPRPARTATAAATPTAAPTAITRVKPVTARNPFIPLVAAAAPTAGGLIPGSTPGTSVTAVPSPGSTPGVAVTPVVPVVPVVPVSPVVVPVRPVETATTSVRMGLVDEDNGIAHLTVDAVSELVVPGQKIGGFTLLNLRDGSCGAIQRGTTVFDLCEGSSRTFR